MATRPGTIKDSGPIHSGVTTAANLHDHTPAAERLHGSAATRLVLRFG